MVDATMTFLIPSFEFTDTGSTNPFGNSGNDGGNAGEVAYIPNFYSIYRFSEDFALTFSMTSNYGLETDYDSDWVGRFHGVNSNLTTVDINPSLAYKVTDWLSVSAGVSANWIHADLSQATVFGGSEADMLLTGSSWSVGGNLGATVNYTEGGRIGFQWRTHIDQTLTGNMRINNNIMAPIEADLTLPQTISAGLYQRLWGDLDRFAVLLDYSYTGWSSFKYLDIKNANTGTTLGGNPVYENWKNVSRISWGINYYPTFDEDMVIRVGAAWDESPVRSAEYRTVRIPCSDRLWASCGVGYKYDNMIFNFAYSYIMFSDSPINNASPSGLGTVNGYYTGEAHLVSIQATLTF